MKGGYTSSHENTQQSLGIKGITRLLPYPRTLNPLVSKVLSKSAPFSNYPIFTISSRYIVYKCVKGCIMTPYYTLIMPTYLPLYFINDIKGLQGLKTKFKTLFKWSEYPSDTNGLHPPTYFPLYSLHLLPYLLQYYPTNTGIFNELYTKL